MFSIIKNIMIGTKLLIAFLAAGLIPFLLMGFIALTLGSNSISDQVTEKLQVV